MDPALGVAIGFGVFAASHVGLATPAIRGPLVRRLGPWGFALLFSCVAAVTFGAAVSFYSLHAGEGPAGPGLGRFEVARALLVTAVVLGVVLMTASLAEYEASPFSMRGADVHEPRGLQRVTRHVFFVGTALLGGAHALLATRLTGAIAMGALALLAVFGARHQDRKLLALRGQPYAEYLASTSTLPFAAALAGRTRVVWRELPLGGLILGLVVAVALRAVHAHVFDYGGAFVIVPTVGGAFSILISEWRSELQRARRNAARTAAHA